MTSPEIENHTPLDQPPNWPMNIYSKHSQTIHNINKKPIIPNIQAQKSEAATTTATTITQTSTSTTTTTVTATTETDTLQSSTNNNPYINNIAVHL